MTLQLAFGNNPINGVLFDLDGTLLDTAADLGAAVNALLARDNRPLISDEVINHTASQGALALIKAGYGEDLDENSYLALRRDFLDHYENNIAVNTQYFAGVEHCISLLNHHRISWGIVTNKPYIYTKILLQHFPLLANCQVTLCGDSMSVRKPSPEPLLVAAKSLAIAPQQIVYVGDARTDIEAANAANMVSISAKYGYIPFDDPCENWHSDLIIDRCNDLFSVLGKMA